MQVDQATAPVSLLGVDRTPIDGGWKLVHHFQSPRGSFDLVSSVTIQQQALRVAFRLENAPPPQPWFVPRIEDVAVNEFAETAERVFVGQGNVVQRPGGFNLGFDGHRLATSHVGLEFPGGVALVQGVDLPPERLEVEPASRHYSLHVDENATFTFVPGENAWQAAAQYRVADSRRAAGGVPRLAGRFVFDLWGGRYAESSAAARTRLPLRPDRRHGRLAQLAAVGLRLPPARDLSAQPAARDAGRAAAD